MIQTTVRLQLPTMRRPMPQEAVVLDLDAAVESRLGTGLDVDVDLDLELDADLEMDDDDDADGDSDAATTLVSGGGAWQDLATWQDRALCSQTDPEAFFPEKGGSTREAKKVCLGCEVRVECLEYALANDERFGIWGGLSERERRRVKREAI